MSSFKYITNIKYNNNALINKPIITSADNKPMDPETLTSINIFIPFKIKANVITISHIFTLRTTKSGKQIKNIIIWKILEIHNENIILELWEWKKNIILELLTVKKNIKYVKKNILTIK